MPNTPAETAFELPAWPDRRAWLLVLEPSVTTSGRADALARLCYRMREYAALGDTDRIVETLNLGLLVAWGLTDEHAASFEHYLAYLSGDLPPDLEPKTVAENAAAVVTTGEREASRKRVRSK